MEIWLVRHGSTQANKEGRLQGTLNFPLSSAGKEEAFCLGERLKAQPFSLILCSDLVRARETAAIISSRKESPPPTLYSSLIREYNWGILQGFTREEIKRRFPIVYKKLDVDLSHTPIPGEEGVGRLFNRAALFYHFLIRISKKYSFPVLVVSHGRFLHAFILFFLHFSYKNSWPFSVSPASISILEEINQRRRIRLFNDVCHLSFMNIRERIQ